MSIKENLSLIKSKLPEGVTLIAVSKTKSIEAIKEAYDAGQRDFGEHRVQELVLCEQIIAQHAAELMERFNSPFARRPSEAVATAPGWALGGAAA